MTNTRIASRYAKSLLDLAIEKGQVDTLFEDMLWLEEVCKKNKDFVNLLRSPVVHSDIKNKIFIAISKGKLGEIANAFIQLLIRKGREIVLPEIIQSFIEQYRVYKKIYRVKLTTAKPASEDLKNSIVDHIRNTTEMKNIELETYVKEDIIGGFVLQAGDQLVDASVAYDLKMIARQFENNDFIYKVR